MLGNLFKINKRFMHFHKVRLGELYHLSFKGNFFFYHFDVLWHDVGHNNASRAKWLAQPPLQNVWPERVVGLYGLGDYMHRT